MRRRVLSALSFLVLAGCYLAPLVLAAGCGSILPTEDRSLVKQESRQSIAQSATTDVVHAATTTPPDVTITTQDGTVTITQPAATQTTTTAKTAAAENSDAAASGLASQSTTIPLFVKLIGGAVGLSMLLGVGWLLLRSSRALRAAYAVADDYLARGINRVRTMAQVETDPARANLLNSIVSGLEAERAEYNKD